MVRVDGLDEHDAGKVAPSGAPGNLGQELEGSFGGAKVGHAQSDVGGDDTDEGDVGDIVPLGDHLGSHEYVEIPFAEAAEQFFVLVFAADRVAVEPRDAGLGKLRCSSASTFSEPLPRK